MKEEIKQAIIKILSGYPHLRRETLLALLSEKYYFYNLSDRELRQIVSETPEIGSSCRRGYYLVRNESDLDDCLADLRSKAKSIFARASMIYEHYHKGKQFQTELLFE